MLLTIRSLLERGAIDYTWAPVRIGYRQKQPLETAVTLPIRWVASHLTTIAWVNEAPVKLFLTALRCDSIIPPWMGEGPTEMG